MVLYQPDVYVFSVMAKKLLSLFHQGLFHRNTFDSGELGCNRSIHEQFHYFIFFFDYIISYNNVFISFRIEEVQSPFTPDRE